MMPKLIVFVMMMILCCSCGAQNKFPPGISFDPAIADIVKKERSANTFIISEFSNDSLVSNKFTDVMNLLPFTPVTIVARGDTDFVFTPLLGESGFQIGLHSGAVKVEYFVSASDCKCFKSFPTDTAYSYGASAEPVNLTLVMNKRSGLKKGDKIRGYIKMSGGAFYHRAAPAAADEKQSYSYEGYFMADFNPIMN